MSESATLTPLGVGFDQLAAAEPDAAAVTFRGQTYSRNYLARRSNQLARRLASLGVSAGDTVTIGLPNGVAPCRNPCRTAYPHRSSPPSSR